jgi:hypothetical protein
MRAVLMNRVQCLAAFCEVWSHLQVHSVPTVYLGAFIGTLGAMYPQHQDSYYQKDQVKHLPSLQEPYIPKG